MTKKKIIMISSLCSILLLSSFYVVNEDKIRVEKNDTKVEVSELTEVEKKPIRQEEKKKSKIVEKVKSIKEVNSTKSPINTTVTFEIIQKKDVSADDIIDLEKSIFHGTDTTDITDYINEYNDEIYFKADFEPLFKEKIGSDIVLDIGGKQYSGELTQSDIEYPTEEDIINDLDTTYYSFDIQQEKEYATITVTGWKDVDGNYAYEGTIIDLVSTNNDKQFFISNNIGVILPEQEYDSFLMKDTVID